MRRVILENRLKRRENSRVKLAARFSFGPRQIKVIKIKETERDLRVFFGNRFDRHAFQRPEIHLGKSRLDFGLNSDPISDDAGRCQSAIEWTRNQRIDLNFLGKSGGNKLGLQNTVRVKRNIG